jgi:hypothetical protein
MIVSPVCNCPAVRQRQPALQSAPFPARILPPECVGVVNGVACSDPPRGAWASPVVGLRHEISSEASAVPWLME